MGWATGACWDAGEGLHLDTGGVCIGVNIFKNSLGGTFKIFPFYSKFDLNEKVKKQNPKSSGGQITKNLVCHFKKNHLEQLKSFKLGIIWQGLSFRTVPTGCCMQRGTELGGVWAQGGGRLWWSPGQDTDSVMVVRMERSGEVTERGDGALVGCGRRGGGSHQGRIRVSGLGNRIDGFIVKVRKREDLHSCRSRNEDKGLTF